MALSRNLLVLVLAVLALALASCGGDDDEEGAAGGPETVTETEPAEQPAPSPPETPPKPGGEAPRAQKVEIVDFTYEPDPVTVAVGGKVTWLNQDSAPHTATAEDDSFDTGTLDEGKIGSATFKQPGSVAYICSIHPTMKGTVKVVGSS